MRVFGGTPALFEAPRELTLTEVEEWLAKDDPSIPSAARATCPRCNGWGVDSRHGRCAFCHGAAVVSVGEWRAELRARIEAATS